MVVLRETEEVGETVTENGVDEPKPEQNEVRPLRYLLFRLVVFLRYRNDLNSHILRCSKV